MFSTRRFQSVAVVALLSFAGQSTADDEMSLFDWLGTAPIVVAAQNIDTYGKFAEFRIERPLRGELLPEQVIRVGVRWANRDRNRELDKEALRFEAGGRYLLLLAPAQMKQKDHSKPAFGLVRGVNGAREIPAEGATPLLEAANEFIQLQHANDDQMTWRRLAEMLQATNPVLLDAALDQYLKFRRGEIRDLESLRPLIAHPVAETRIRALTVSAQILEKAADEPLPDAEPLRVEFLGRARRDDDPRVRSAAVEALSRLEQPDVDRLLEEIARDDPDQGVRYVAERRLLERKESRVVSVKGEDGTR